MFENTPSSYPPQPPTPPSQNPLNPPMPAPGMQPPMTGVPATPSPEPPTTEQPQIHTMPERFRATGGGGKGPGGNRRLMIILLVVLGVAILVGGGLYAYNRFLLDETNTNGNANTNSPLNENENANANENTNADLNENTNGSGDANGNLNSNGNENTNSVGNDNANANANSNDNTNSSTNANTNTSTTPLPSSSDTDNDGLTDVEEGVYTTNVSNPDSDGDTFVDGRQLGTDGNIGGELYLGYNPKGAGTLESSDLVRRVMDSGNTYSTLIPKAWTVTTDTQGGILITPTNNSGEFFQIRSHENSTRLSPVQWYLQNNPAASVDAIGTVTVNGLEGIISEDGSTVYLFKDAAVYGIQYGTGSATQANYRTTFDVIVRNFKLVAAS